jgi:hypothetical protein
MKNKKVINSQGDEYDSISQACRTIGCNLTSLRYAIKNGTMVKDFQWRYFDGNFAKPKTIYKRPVVREDGVEYESLTQAALLHKVTYLAIRHAILNN